MVEKIETITCPVCKGDSTPDNPCKYCSNEHKVKMTIKQEGRTVTAILKCLQCFGSGKTLDGNKCYNCHGTGIESHEERKENTALTWIFIIIGFLVILFIRMAKAPFIVDITVIGITWGSYEILKRIL